MGCLVCKNLSSSIHGRFATFWLDDERIHPIRVEQTAQHLLLGTWNPRLQLLVALKAVFLENYLTVSPWILNGSSIEYLEKKYQPFSLAGVRFGSLENQISGLKSAWHRADFVGLCCYCCYKWIVWGNPRNQTNIFRLNVTLTESRSQSCIIKSFFAGLEI